MAVKFANNVSTTLSSAINATQTTISVADASGLPSLSSGDYIYLTIDTDTASPTLEVVKVTAVSSNDLTVVRGQDGTTASSFSAGVKVELRVTAAALDDISSAADTESVSISGDTMTGALAINSGSDGILTLNQATTGWNYIQFQANGTRKFYVGNNATDGFVVGSDVSGRLFQLESFGELNLGSANIKTSGDLVSTDSQINIKTTYNGQPYTGGYALVDYFVGNTSLRAPIFYDSANTGYYLDPASTGTSLKVAGTIIAEGAGSSLKGPVYIAAQNTTGEGGEITLNGSNGNTSHTLDTVNGTFRIFETGGTFLSGNYSYGLTTTQYRVGGTTVIDSSRNVSAVDVTATGNVSLTGALLVNGNTAVDKSGSNYMVYHDGGGGPALYAGNSTDNRNYYQSNHHRFRSDDSSTNFAEISSVGMIIGSSGPESNMGKLHVKASDSGATPYQNGNGGITIESAGRAALNFLTPNNQDAYIFWGDPQSANAGYVGYEHANDVLVLKSAGYVKTSGSGLNISAGYLQMGGTGVIDASRNATFNQVTVADFVKATGNNLKFSAGGNHILNIDLNGKVYPQTDNHTDLGFSTSAARFRNLYLSGAIHANSYTGSLTSTVTATTQSASDNSTKVATTAYVDSAVSGIVDSAPGTLNTLNELAAALGDDANFSTTVTNSIATKLPLAGGTMTGSIQLPRTADVKWQDGGGSYSNIITAGLYPSQGFTGNNTYWIEYAAKGGHNFIVNTDGGSTAGENSYDHFTIWQGAVDGLKLFNITNRGRAFFTNDVDLGSKDIKSVDQLFLSRAQDGNDYDAINIAFRGSWSSNQDDLAGVHVTDSNTQSQTVGRFGITYGSGGGSFVVTDLFDSNYGNSGDVFRVRGNGNAELQGDLLLTGGGMVEAPSVSGGESLTLRAAGGVFVDIDSNGNSGDNQFFKVRKHTNGGTELFTVKETGDVNIVSGALQIGGANAIDAARRNIYLDSFAGGNGHGIHFRTGFTSTSNKYNASITVQDHNGASADGLHISGYDGVSIGTGGNTYSVDLLVDVNGNTTIYGGADLASQQGIVRVTTGSIAHTDTSTRGLVVDGNYINGQYRHRWRKQDNGGGVPLYLDYAAGTANSFTTIARFGPYTSNSENLEVYGGFKATSIASTGTASIGGSATLSGGFTASASSVVNGELNVSRNGGVTGTSAPQYSDVNIELQTSSNHVPGISFHRGGYSATTLYEYDGELYVNPWTTRSQTGKLLVENTGWVKQGSWYGDLGSHGYDRVQGVSYTGGEFVLVEKNAQVSTLIDGAYLSYEGGNGFFHSYNSQYGNLTGIQATATNDLTVKQLDGGTANLQVTGNIGTGKLELNGGAYEGSIVFGTSDAWHCGIRQHDDADAEMRIWHKHANGMIFLATGYDGEPSSISRPTDGLVVQGNKVGIGNFSSVDPQSKLHIKSTGDAQLRLDGDGTSWAGIQFADNAGSDYLWYFGATDTWSFGGGGSSSNSNKRIHSHGGMTIGSSLTNSAPPNEGLMVQGEIHQNSNKIVRDSNNRYVSGGGSYYGSGSAGWYKVAQITVTGNCSGAVIYGHLEDRAYHDVQHFDIAVVIRAECSFTSNNEDHFVEIGCTLTSGSRETNYRNKIRAVLVGSSTNSRTYELQFYETSWNEDYWELWTSGWTLYASPQAPGTATGTARINYQSKMNAERFYANDAMHSPIYYDSNTAYYINGASTSRLASLGVGNGGSNASGSYPFGVKHGGRYLTYLENTSNSYGNYPWLVNDDYDGADGFIVHFNAIGDRFSVNANGDALLYNNLKIGRHLDAVNAWDGTGSNRKALFLGWYSDKVIIGNNDDSVHDTAYSYPDDAIICGNPLYGHMDIKSRTALKVGSSEQKWQVYGTHSMSGHSVSSISFDWDGNYDDATYHGIMSTNASGTYGDNLSINSFNDISVRLDSNNNNGPSYFRIYNNTNTNGGQLPFWTGYNGSLEQTRIMGRIGLNTEPRTDGYVLALGGAVYGGNDDINYINQLHFQDNVRFYDDGNDSYLNFKYGDANYGGILFRNGSGNIKGYIYGDNSGFGVLDNDGNWALETRTGANSLRLRCNNQIGLEVGTDTVSTPHKIILGTFPNSTTNSGEAWIGRASDRAAGTMTVQLGSGSGRRFEVVDSGWTTVEFEAGDNGVAVANQSFRSIWFYNRSNASYGIGMGQGSTANRNTTPHGYIDFGPMNAGGAHIYTDRARFYFNSRVVCIENHFSSYGGDLQLKRNESDTYKCYISTGGLVSTQNVTAYSDRRLKTDIEPITGALATVQKLQGVKYTRIDSGNKDIGFIAQEIEESCPEIADRIVNTADDEMGTKNLNYQNMVALLTEAIKEQQSQIEALQSEVKSLQEKLQ